ncbi:MAG TPA: hypothetical protein VEQ60_06485, partial [Longimicrobium sp.]|nr:hypothetical protein [Longimicrobium sp.]
MDVLRSALGTIVEGPIVLVGFVALVAILLAAFARVPWPLVGRLIVVLAITTTAVLLMEPADLQTRAETPPGTLRPRLAGTEGADSAKGSEPAPPAPAGPQPAAIRPVSARALSPESLVVRARDRLRMGAHAEAFRDFDDAQSRFSGTGGADAGLVREAKKAYARGEYQTA